MPYPAGQTAEVKREEGEMSRYLTLELEVEGPAKAVPGQRRSGDLFFANNLPCCFDEVQAAAERLGMDGVFDFAEGLDQTRSAAEAAVYGKSMKEFGPDDEITDEREDEVDRIYYRTGPWFAGSGDADGDGTDPAFRDQPPRTGRMPPRRGVVPDLKQLLEALEEARRRGRRFRLHYSY